MRSCFEFEHEGRRRPRLNGIASGRKAWGTASEHQRFGAPFKNLNAFLVQEPDARGIGDLGFHKNSLRLFFCGLSISYHSDVDTLYATLIAASYRPDTAPRDAEWGERFFHLASLVHCDSVNPPMRIRVAANMVL